MEKIVKSREHRVTLRFPLVPKLNLGMQLIEKMDFAYNHVTKCNFVTREIYSRSKVPALEWTNVPKLGLGNKIYLYN